jgi:hypothetical protein
VYKLYKQEKQKDKWKHSRNETNEIDV